ncbi:uncharacterized protein LOC129258330 isoform X2 [Lytechinus pictus]|uniref:uncharacterized protein LOC129258330 isoform X2 n=1 Tax=Lytechinus pictus TaxID=7653 RepID=UPI0030B9B247
MGPTPSRPPESEKPTLRKNELLELSRKLSFSIVTEVLHRLTCTIPQARIDDTRGNPDRVFKLLLEWHKGCGSPSEARAKLSVALSLSGRQDLADELESNEILHVTLCRQILAFKYESLLEENKWKDDSYIKPRLKHLSDSGISEQPAFDPYDCLVMPGKSIIIEGEVGMGKTMLMKGILAEWVRRYKRGVSLPLLFFLASDEIKEEDSLHSVIYRKYFGSCEGITENELSDYIIGDPHGCLIAIDAVPKMRSLLKTQIGRSFQNSMGMSKYELSLIITSRPRDSAYFSSDLKFKIDSLNAEEVEMYVRNAYSSPKDEEHGRKLVEFLQRNSIVCNDLCSIPLLCGVMCRHWSICRQQEESHMQQRMEFCHGITHFSKLVAEALVHDKITDIKPLLSPTPGFNFLLQLKNSGDCGNRAHAEDLLQKNMENLGQVAFKKLKKDSISFREADFTVCPRSYKIACLTGVLVKRGSCIEFFHPIIQAYCVAAYIVKLHHRGTREFNKTLCELDSCVSSLRKWVYRFVSGDSHIETAKDVINHLARNSSTHNILCESLAEVYENSDTLQDEHLVIVPPDFHDITWPSAIVLKDPTSRTIGGFYSVAKYANNVISEVTIHNMSSYGDEDIQSPQAFQQLQELRFNLGALIMTECDLHRCTLLFKALTQRTLQVLDLSGSTSIEDLSDAPERFLSRLPDLTTLRLPNMDQYPCLLLASLPDCCAGLKELSLAFRRFCSHSGSCMVCNSRFEKLETLAIKCPCSVVPSQLAHIISCTNILGSMSFACDGIDEGFIESLETLMHVHRVFVEVNSIERDTLDCILQKIPGLKHFKLAFGGRHEADIINTFTALSSSSNITELDVSYIVPDTPYSDRPPSSPALMRNMHDLIGKLRNLRILAMTDVPLGNTAALEILQDMRSEKITVTDLRLVRCNTQSSGPFDVCREIRRKGCDVSIVHGTSGCKNDSEPTESRRGQSVTGAEGIQLSRDARDDRSGQATRPKRSISWRSTFPLQRPSVKYIEDNELMPEIPPPKRCDTSSSRHQPKAVVSPEISSSGVGDPQMTSAEEHLRMVSLPVLLPHTLKMRLSEQLQSNTFTGNDWRALAEKFHIDKYAARMSRHPNPPEALFDVAMERRCFTSLEELADVFESIEREDCKHEVMEYMQQMNDE